MIDIFTTSLLIGILLGFGAMFGVYLYGRVVDEFASESNKKNLKRYKIWKC